MTSTRGLPVEHVRPLTGLRFWAALHVVLFHTLNRGNSMVGRIVKSGPLAVSLFFVLSGFILAFTYLRDGRLESTRQFWIARVARIYPVYLLGIALVLLFGALPPAGGAPHGNDLVTPGAVTASLLLVQSWSPRLACMVNCPGWSLADEAFFYALFPVLALLLTGRSARPLMVAVGVAWLASLAFAVAFVGTAGGIFRSYATTFGGGVISVFKYHPVVRLPEFVLGVALGLLAVTHRVQFGKKTKAWSVVAMLTSAWILAAEWLLPGGSLGYAGVAILLPAFGLLILSLTFAGGVVEEFFGNPLAVHLGEMSYALYIVHIPIVLIYLRIASYGYAPHPTVLSGLLLEFACIFATAYAAFRFIELPARRAIRARFALN